MGKASLIVQSASFDQNGNILVSDGGNNPVQISMDKESTWMRVMELKEVSIVDWINLQIQT